MTHLTTNIWSRVDALLLRASARPQRLIGLSIMRIALAVAALVFYASDLWDAKLLWGPNSYNTASDASTNLSRGLFSLYLAFNTTTELYVLLALGIIVACAFGVFGGKWLTLAQAVMMWSIYNRNQDLLEGGDNFARIALIFLCFTTCNAYFSPRARKRRDKLELKEQGSVEILLHNIGAFLVVFQVVVVYSVAGWFKMTATIWNDGVAMYYVSRIHEFQMFSIYPYVFRSALLSWIVSWCTIVFEMAVPFVVLIRRNRWVREVVTFGLEGMHLGIIIFMGLVAFGLIFIGADSALLTDADYQSLQKLAARIRLWKVVPVSARQLVLEVAEPRQAVSAEPASAETAN